MQHNKPVSVRYPGQKIIYWIVRFEELLLTLLLTTMILLAGYQIALRWLTSGGLPWIDPLLRYLVLWGGLLGAVLATAKDHHISLDIVSYLLSARARQWLKLVTHGFSVIVSVFLFRATLLFIRSEIEFGGASLFGLQSWVWNLIFPIAFALICLHFIIALLGTVIALFLPLPDDSHG